MREGTLYSDQSLEITLQTQTIRYLIRLMLTFKSKDPLYQVSDVSVKVMNPSFLMSCYQIECSPVRYVPGQPPQAIVMCMMKQASLASPKLLVSCQCSPMEPKKNGLEVKLPIFANKVIENVEQLSEQAFKKNWDDITFKRPEFHKMDTVLRNPAPSHIPISQVLDQIANFFQGSLNLKVFRPTANKV